MRVQGLVAAGAFLCFAANAWAAQYDGQWRVTGAASPYCSGVLMFVVNGSDITGTAGFAGASSLPFTGTVSPDGSFTIHTLRGAAVSGKFSGDEFSGAAQVSCGRLTLTGRRVGS